MARAAGAIVLDRVPMLRPDQAAIAMHPAKRKAVCMGRRWGKTVFGLVLVVSALLLGMRVAWMVPTYRNSNPLWRAVEAALAPLRKAGRATFNRSERTIELWNGGFLGIYTADNPDAMRGEWFHLVIIDEAARVPEAVIEEVVEPTLADVDGELVAISSPHGKNWFYRLWVRGREDMNAVAGFQAPTSANPSPLIRKAYERAKLYFGEDSTTFRQEWGGEFVDSGAAVWQREWCEDRYDVGDEAMERSVIARMLTYDTANKDKKTNAYTACGVIELLADYRARLRHVWRERLLMPNLVARVQGDEATTGDIVRWNYDGKLSAVVIEDRASGTGLYQTIYKAGTPELQAMLVAFQPTGSKDDRFGQAGIWVKNKSFLLPKPSDETRWLHAWEGEIFEEDQYKDQRDTTAQGILYWEHLLAEGHRARTGTVAA